MDKYPTTPYHMCCDDHYGMVKNANLESFLLSFIIFAFHFKRGKFQTQNIVKKYEKLKKTTKIKDFLGKIWIKKGADDY